MMLSHRTPQIATDPRYGNLACWRSHRPGYGAVVCFPIAYDLGQMNKDFWLRDFPRLAWNPKNVKHFYENFPQLPKEHNGTHSLVSTAVLS